MTVIYLAYLLMLHILPNPQIFAPVSNAVLEIPVYIFWST